YITTIGVFPNVPILGKTDGSYIAVYFQDPKGMKNYYRLKEYVNDSLQDNGNFMLYDNKYTDGKFIEYDFPKPVHVGDSVVVQLVCINQHTYEYYQGVNDAING